MPFVIFTGEPGTRRQEDGEWYEREKDLCQVTDARAEALVGAGLARLVTSRGDPSPTTNLDSAVDPYSRIPKTKVRWLGRDKAVTSDPLLWFVIATRNRCAELKQQIEAIFASKDVPEDRIRIVVVNDAGDDVMPSLPADDRIIAVSTMKSHGPNYARHLGVKLAPPEAVIVEADDHDYLEPFAAAAIREAFTRQGVHVVYGDHWRHTSAGERLAIRAFSEKMEYYPGAFMDHGALHMGVRAYRRGLYAAVGGYRMDEVPAGDLGLFLRFESVLRGSGIMHIPKPLCSVCVNMDGISLTRREEQSQMARRLKWRASVGALFSDDRVAPGAAFQRTPEPEAPRYDVDEVVLKDELSRDNSMVACITAFRSEDVIGKCLDHLRAAGVPSSVCLNGAPDAVRDIALEKADHVVELSKNCGYGHGMNTAVKHALTHGTETVMTCCADAFVPPGAAQHAYAELKRLGAAGVATTHVSPGGVVNSHGSEWVWRQDGREMRQTRQVPNPLTDPLEGQEPPIERDFITFANSLWRADVWQELDGLDERYLVGYWEDSDFCGRARRLGHHMYWVGGPPVEHLLGKGGGGGGNPGAWQHNANLFRSRFEDTGLVDKWARRRGLRPLSGTVTACVIALNEEEFIVPSIGSAYDFVDRIIVIVGGAAPAYDAGMCTEDGLPIDNTLAKLRSINDPGHKMEVVLPPGRPWWDKNEQRQAYANMLSDGDWMLLLDADEVFMDEGLWRLSRHAHFADVILPGHWVIWNNFDTVGTQIWDTFPQHKLVKWRAGFNYKTSHTIIQDEAGRNIQTLSNLKVIDATPEKLYVHYAWVRPLEKIRQKVEYYRNANPGFDRRNYYEDVFLAWRRDPERVERELGTHPRGRGGTGPFPREHPPSIKKLLKSGELGGEGW